MVLHKLSINDIEKGGIGSGRKPTGIRPVSVTSLRKKEETVKPKFEIGDTVDYGGTEHILLAKNGNEVLLQAPDTEQNILADIRDIKHV